MRIGMMIDMYKPYISGVTNYVAINKKFLEEAGHEVFVFTFGNKDYEDDESNIIRSGTIPFPFARHKFYFSYSQQARQLISTMDVVHVQHPFISGSLSILTCRSRGIPIVFTSHTRYDIYSKVYVPLFADLIGKFLMSVYLPAFFKRVDLVISPSKGMRQVLIESGAKVPIDVVPNGVDLRAFLAPAMPVARAEMGLSDSDVIFVFVGRLGIEKNLWFLLNAFELAYRSCTSIGLVLIGEGPLRKEMQEWISAHGLDERVIFTGLIPYPQMPEYYAMADVFVTPSVSEVHPFTIIEAMAAGLPVVGINSPGVGDTVLDGETGYLCETEDQDKFANQMVELAQDQDRRRRLGKQARLESQQYDIHNTVQTMLERYQSVIDLAARRRAVKTSQPRNLT